MNVLNARGQRDIFMVLGHLKPGVTPAQAIADLNSLARTSKRPIPKTMPNDLYLARPSLAGDMLGPPVKGIHDGNDAAGGVDSAGRMRQPGQPVCRARRRPFPRSCSAPRAGIEPQAHSARSLYRSRADFARREARWDSAGSVALLRRLSAWQPIPQYPMHMPVNRTQMSMAALLLGVGQRIPLWRGPGEADTSHQSIRGGQGGIGGIIAGNWAADYRSATCCWWCRLPSARCWSLLRWSPCVGWCARCTATSVSSRRTPMLVDTDLSMAGYSGDKVPPCKGA
jgi:hypothetical protein